MAYGFWKHRMEQRESVFHLFYRKNPYSGPCTVAAGLELAIDILERFRFTADDIQYLGSLKGNDGKALFEIGFLNYLQRMRLELTVDGVAEGTIVFPNQPLLRVRGPLLQAQIVESALLNVINFSTLIATKSARIVTAAAGDAVLEFGLRRAQGIDGALTASRAAFIGGCGATSNLHAGRFYGIPVKGTHAHSWVMCFEDEIAAFEAYAEAMPNNTIFLVDTYDTLEGVANAIRVGQRLRERGYELNGIRLDSGDLAALSIKARHLLDEAGFGKAKIVASDSLDEHSISEIKARGGTIAIWGIGTRLVVGKPEGALGGVYKLSAIADAAGRLQDRIKLSDTPIKMSNPGILQIRRLLDGDQKPLADLLVDIRDTEVKDYRGVDMAGQADRHWSPAHTEDLLQPVFRSGERVYDSPPLIEIQAYARQQVKIFDWVLNEFDYFTGLEYRVHQRKQALIRDYQMNEGEK